MITFLGDIHGDYMRLQDAAYEAYIDGSVALIQVGDFGLFRENEHQFEASLKNIKIPIYFIDGNHDDCVRWKEYKEVSQLFPNINLFYIPRGEVVEIGGITMAFMGGASSIDKKLRLDWKLHWDENENISKEQIQRLRKNIKGKKIDFFVTHTPPKSVVDEHFDPRGKLNFGVSIDWLDPNQLIIEDLWKEMGYPTNYSGHMHRKVSGMTYRILDINELSHVVYLGR